MRVIIYIRVSTQEQNKNGYSVGEQESKLRKYCEAKGWEVLVVYIDGGYSGATKERPALQNLIQDVIEHRADAVLVYKLDRLSRSQKDTLELIEDVFLPNGVDFVSMTENFDTSTPFGMAMVGLLSVFAQLERAQIKERMAIGMEGRAKEGKYHGSGASPVGYSYKDDKLEIIDYEAMLLREAFETFNRRISAHAICRDFEKRGMRHRYGYFSTPTLLRALRNPLYAGYIKKDGILYDGKHQAIVSRETFETTQRILAERDKDNPNRKTAFKRNSLLGGLVYCKHCGAKYCKVLGPKKVDGTKTEFFSCNSRNKKNKAAIMNPNCKNKIWRMRELDAAIIEQVTKLAIDPSFVESIMHNEEIENDKPQRIELLEQKIAELSEQISLYSDLYSIKQLTMDEVKAKIEPLAAERNGLQNEIAALKKVNEATTEQTIEYARSFGEYLEKQDSEGARFVLEELINKIELNDEHVRIFWTFE